MHAKIDFSRKQTVVCLNMQAVDVHVQLLGEDACDFVQHTYAITAYNMKRGREGKVSVRLPLGSQDLVAVACLETLRHFTLPLMDDNMLVVEVAKNIVTRDGMAAITDDVAADSLFVQDERLLPVYLKRRLFYLGRH